MVSWLVGVSSNSVNLPTHTAYYHGIIKNFFKSNKLHQSADFQNKHVILRNSGSNTEYIKTEVILIVSFAAK